MPNVLPFANHTITENILTGPILPAPLFLPTAHAIMSTGISFTTCGSLP